MRLVCGSVSGLMASMFPSPLMTIASFDDDLENELDTNNNDSVKVNPKTTPEYYLKFFPLTKEKMDISHNKIIEALYSLGNIYREDFQDYKNSIAVDVKDTFSWSDGTKLRQNNYKFD